MESTENKLMCYVFFEIFHTIFFFFTLSIKSKGSRKREEEVFSQ